jgi:hypothetical protein
MGWEHIERWRQQRLELPVGPFLCLIDGATSGRAWSRTGARAEAATTLSAGRRAAQVAPHQLRHAHAVDMARQGVPLPGHPAPARPCVARRDQHLSTRHRYDGNHQRRPRTARARDPGQRRPTSLSAPIKRSITHPARGPPPPGPRSEGHSKIFRDDEHGGPARRHRSLARHWIRCARGSHRQAGLVWSSHGGPRLQLSSGAVL